MLKLAVEMRRLSSPETQFILKLGDQIRAVGQCIQVEANNGKTFLDYKVDSTDERFLKSLENELVNSGYVVTRKDSKLKITWA